MEDEEDHLSNFPGRVFVGGDALKGSYKSNPMLKVCCFISYSLIYASLLLLLLVLMILLV
jgi:hypothetical protein